jgi:hypothetical protein
MAKKKNQILSTRVASTPAERELQHLKHKDLQRACVGRGMDFQAVVNGSIPDLQGWFCKNYDNGQNLQLLDDFDLWKDGELMKRGHVKGDPVFHPILRLGFVGKLDEEGNIVETKKPRLKSLDKKEKPKRERIEGTKIFSGTKKALTYELTAQKEKDKSDTYTIPEIVKLVTEQFPEAKEKSIRIWIGRVRKKVKK